MRWWQSLKHFWRHGFELQQPRLTARRIDEYFADTQPGPYPSAVVREELAEAYDKSAPPMGWPGPNE